MTDRTAKPAPEWVEWLRRRWGLLVVVVVLVAVAAVRVRLRDFPLERDEGEYAYAGQLLLQGIPPYQLAYNMKFPGAYAVHALIMAVFGETPAGIHLGLTVVTTLTALLLYWFGRRRIDELAGVVAATSCAVLSACPSLLGLASHATHYAALFATAGLCVGWPFRVAGKAWRLLAAGLLFGLAVLMKQHAAILCLWAVGMLAAAGLRQAPAGWAKTVRDIGAFCLGAILPFGIACLLLWHAGVFKQFWFWTIRYAGEYVAEVRWGEVPLLFWTGLTGATARCALIWATAAAGLALIWRDGRRRESRWSLVSFFLASFLTTCPGFYFRNHYFLLMVPALSLLAGCAVSAARELLTRKPRWAALAAWPALTYILFVAVGVAQNADVWFARSPLQACRRVYGVNPFPEAGTVAAFLRDHSAATDRIAVLGSEPEIYFLSRRHSATGYIYTFALMERHPYARRMQEEMIREIESQRPKFVVYAASNASWWASLESETLLLEWWMRSYQTNYSLVGAAEPAAGGGTRFLRGAEVADYVRGPATALMVYQRRDR